MPTADQTKLLEALAAGGKATGDAYLAAQSADQAAQADTMKSALAHAAGLGINGEAQGQLRAIMNAPFQNAATYSKATNDAFQRQNYARLYNTSLWSDANTKINEQLRKKVEDELLKKIHDSLTSSSISSGGGGGGGSGGGGGGGRGSGGGTAGKASDWVKQIRADAGLTGTGLSSAKYLSKYLASASAQDPNYIDLPRDLRARQYAVDYYGADPNLVDAVAPISGFLKKALQALSYYKNGNLTTGSGKNMVRITTPEQFFAYLHNAAVGLPGDQHKAVRYVMAQVPPPRPNPLEAAGQAIGNAPATVAATVAKAVDKFAGLSPF